MGIFIKEVSYPFHMVDFIANALTDGRLVIATQGLVLPPDFNYHSHLPAVKVIQETQSAYADAMRAAQPQLAELELKNDHDAFYSLKEEIQGKLPLREIAIKLLGQRNQEGEEAARQYMRTIGALLTEQGTDQPFPFVFVERCGSEYSQEYSRQVVANLENNATNTCYIVEPFVFAADSYFSRTNKDEKSRSNERKYIGQFLNPDTGEWIDSRVKSLHTITIMRPPKDTKEAADFRKKALERSGLRIEDFAKDSPLW